jgi:F-type H+-transporting ATPase subunit delta
LALLNLASEANKVDKVASDLHDFVGSWTDSRDLRAAFENPSVSLQTRHQILRDVAQSSNMDELVRNTLLLMVDHGRLSHLTELVDSFDALAQARSGRVRADVVTATEMPEAYFSELQKTLERVTGKQVVVSHSVDASLIGGVVARVGDQIFDGSVKHRLAELKDELNH